MEISSLRLRMISFKDSKKQPLNDTLFYVKKLTEIQLSPESPTILEPNNRATAFVLSSNETFDWHIDEGNYCQILFLSPEAKAKARGDIMLWFNHLAKVLQDRRHLEQHEPEFHCDAPLEPNCLFEFTLQIPNQIMSLIPSTSTTEKKLHLHKVSRRQPIRGHLMKLKQFNQPVYCALCNEFVWGLRHQGYECTRCFLVTDKKCHRRIPFWCQKSPYPEPTSSQRSGIMKFHMTHLFKEYEAPIFRAVFTRDHCFHCGSKVFVNALKCTQCHFIIHEHCKSNVPPMCTVHYKSLADALANEAVDLGAIGLVRMHSRTEADIESVIPPPDDHHSQSPSVDFTWLEPPLTQILTCPQTGAFLLPKFSDFQFIGRLGDGACAKVYCAQHIPSKKYVAIKVANGANEEARHQLEVERQILFRYGDRNRYMVKAYCTFHHATQLFLVMELVQGGTLDNRIIRARMNEDEIRFYLAELICVIQYLHSNNIVYRDLKLEHAIVCSEGHIRLVDYGLGRFLKNPDEKCHTCCGTMYYMAPEVRRLQTNENSEGYSFAVDYWALGIMLVQMLFGEQLDFLPLVISSFTENPNADTSIVEQLDLPTHVSTAAKECIRGLLEIDPEKRLGSPNSPHGQIRNHRFFKEGCRIEWQDMEDGIIKSPYKNPLYADLSERSVDLPLASLALDREAPARDGWLAAGRSTATAEEEKLLKSFDHVNVSAWLELINSI